jgi:hypothetical protein
MTVSAAAPVGLAAVFSLDRDGVLAALCCASLLEAVGLILGSAPLTR